MTLIQDDNEMWLYINDEGIQVSPSFHTREVAEHWLSTDYGGE